MLFTSDNKRGRCFRPHAHVCLSVCVEDYLKPSGWIWIKCCVLTDVGTWTNWLIFEPDLDHSLDARTELLSPNAYALQCGILWCQENPYWAPVAAATHGFWVVCVVVCNVEFYYVGKIPRTGIGCLSKQQRVVLRHQNTIVVSKCALPSSLLVLEISIFIVF